MNDRFLRLQKTLAAVSNLILGNPLWRRLVVFAAATVLTVLITLLMRDGNRFALPTTVGSPATSAVQQAEPTATMAPDSTETPTATVSWSPTPTASATPTSTSATPTLD